MARTALARVRRGRDSPQARGGGGSGALDTDCQSAAYAVCGAEPAIVTRGDESVNVSTARTVHVALVHPVGIVGQHG